MRTQATVLMCPETEAQLTAGLERVLLEGQPQLPAPEPESEYRRVTLRCDAHLELVAARWRSGGASTLHGHGASAAAYRVVHGAIEEERFLPTDEGFRRETIILRAGQTATLPPGAYHRVRALADAVTVHAYSPPMAQLNPPIPEGVAEQGLRCDSLPEVLDRYLPEWERREIEANRSGQTRMPATTLAEMRASGVLAAPIPVEQGGWGATLSEVTAFIRGVARHAPSTALALVMPLGNAATCRIPPAAVPAHLRSALAQGQAWIAEQAGRGRILAVANSEPGAGGELANTRTQAERGGDGVYRLTGRKSFATFGRDADAFLCAARRVGEQAGEKAEVIDGFFIFRDAPGLVVDDSWNPAGMRPTASVGLSLAGAPAVAILGYPGCLEGVNARHWSTLLFAAVFVGVGEGALREAVRQTGNEAIWARGALAEAALALDAAAGFVESAAASDAYPLPAEPAERTRRAKTFAARSAVEAATKAAMVSGGRSYTPDSPVFRFLCDALAGPLLRPPLPQAMDAVVKQLFPAPKAVQMAA